MDPKEQKDKPEILTDEIHGDNSLAYSRQHHREEGIHEEPFKNLTVSENHEQIGPNPDENRIAQDQDVDSIRTITSNSVVAPQNDLLQHQECQSP